MTQDAIFSPFFATVFLTLIVWVYMSIRRISFITSKKLGQKDRSCSTGRTGTNFAAKRIQSIG